MDDIEELENTLSGIEGTIDAIYTELTKTGEPSIKGLLLEQERRGDFIENNVLAHIQNYLVEIKKAILVSALVIAKPANPNDTLAKAYKSVETFLTTKGA